MRHTVSGYLQGTLKICREDSLTGVFFSLFLRAPTGGGTGQASAAQHSTAVAKAEKRSTRQCRMCERGRGGQSLCIRVYVPCSSLE